MGGNGVKGKIKWQITGQKYEYYLKKWVQGKGLNTVESKKGANFIQKYEYQSEKFDVARLKVREQLTKKGKFDSENGSFIRQQGKGEGKIWGQNIKENEEESKSKNVTWKKDEN